MSELIPCPFCDVNEWKYQSHFSGTMIYQCEKCGTIVEEWVINIRPIEDALNARIAELKGVIEILEDQQREVKNILIDKNLHIDSLYEEGYKLQQRIAELEAAQRWIPVSERLPEESGWYRVGAINVYYEGYTDEVYFDADKNKLGWQSSVRDKVYCWLDGVPELPRPSEMQE